MSLKQSPTMVTNYNESGEIESADPHEMIWNMHFEHILGYFIVRQYDLLHRCGCEGAKIKRAPDSF